MKIAPIVAHLFDQAGEAPVFGALRGLERVRWSFTLAAAAYNLIGAPG
jgi:hypothetical protein